MKQREPQFGEDRTSMSGSPPQKHDGHFTLEINGTLPSGIFTELVAKLKTEPSLTGRALKNDENYRFSHGIPI